MESLGANKKSSTFGGMGRGDFYSKNLSIFDSVYIALCAHMNYRDLINEEYGMSWFMEFERISIDQVQIKRWCMPLFFSK